MRPAAPSRMDLRRRVVVITGASSGLGRAIALEIARRGGNVVLAARRRHALEDTAQRCRAAGAEALVVPTDVTSEQEVDNLTKLAMERFGSIDIWINNAGVTLYEKLEYGPLEQNRRVIETNLIGTIIGARAAVTVFREQGHGVLINMGSVLSHVGQAFVPAYVISKHGVRGVSEALRVELADQPDIHVCTVCPYAIDTQHFEVAASGIGRAPFALPPVQSPEKVARAVADVCERPRRMRYVPRIIALGVVAHAIAPRTSERLLLAALRRWHMSNEPQAIGQGNLYDPPAVAAHTHGTRPPMISTPGLVAWLSLQLVKHGAESVRRRTNGLARAPRAGAQAVLPVDRPRRTARGTTSPMQPRARTGGWFATFAARAVRLVARYQIAISVATLGFAARALAKQTHHVDPRVRVAARATRWMLQRRELAARSA
ncbi:MAG: SDR family NAD(P)-dependent oxidoreductase [Deltaproteobacteria bacterium]|nr:SDR family NAD(P)-dependent oxidoreductase [Deltaproteobacteria bacterium]